VGAFQFGSLMPFVILTSLCEGRIPDRPRIGGGSFMLRIQDDICSFSSTKLKHGDMFVS
jgi:hypothetical protein